MKGMWSRIGVKEKIMIITGFILIFIGILNDYLFDLSNSKELLVLFAGSMMILLVWVSYACRIKALKKK